MGCDKPAWLTSSPISKMYSAPYLELALVATLACPGNPHICSLHVLPAMLRGLCGVAVPYPADSSHGGLGYPLLLQRRSHLTG